MANIQMRGLDEYTRALSRLDLIARDRVCGKAVYEGAGIVADAVKSAILSIPTDEAWGTSSNPTSGPQMRQKQGLYHSLGITKMRNDNGFLNVKIGFSGYNEIKTRRWPQGQPNAMVARSIERGTSFMRANPFVKKAVSGVRQAVLAAMQRSINNSLREL